MSYLRLIGVVCAMAIWWYAVAQHRAGRYRRGELLLALLVGGALGAVSVAPGIVDVLTAVFAVPTRLMALTIAGNIVLFALVLVLFKHLSELRGSMSDLVRSLARSAYSTDATGPSAGSITVVIPAFDEQPNLERMLPTLPAQACGRPVRALVVADGARDRSADVAQRHAAGVTSHAINRGQGDALRTGFEIALHDGADIVVTMDADGQHRPEEIARLVQPIIDDQADFVLGSRVRGEYEERGSARHAGIVIFSVIVSWLAGTRVSDCTNGFRAIRGAALQRLELRESRFSAPELIIEAAAKGLRIREVPVSVLARHHGQSKKPGSWRYPFGFTLAIVRAWLRS